MNKKKGIVGKLISAILAIAMIITLAPFDALSVHAAGSKGAKILIWSTYCTGNETFDADLADLLKSSEIKKYAGLNTVIVDKKVNRSYEKEQHFSADDDLSEYDMVVVFLPFYALNDTDIAVLKKYVENGGRIVLQGEWESDETEDAVLNKCAQGLGVNIELKPLNASQEWNYAVINPDADMIGGKPLDGDNLYYMAVSEIKYGSGVKVIAKSVAQKYPFIVEAKSGEGYVIAMTDINWWYTKPGTSAYDLWARFIGEGKNIQEHEHDWGEGVISSYPTEIEKGTVKYVCSICNEEKVEPLELGETLYRINGTWFYIKDSLIGFRYTKLFKYNGAWFYVQDGIVDLKDTRLYTWNSTTYYIENGRVNFKTNTLKKFGNDWYNIIDGRVHKGRTLIKYNNSWWFVENGKVNFAAETLIKYNNVWYYVKNGKVDFSYTGYVTYTNGHRYYVKNGRKVSRA